MHTTVFQMEVLYSILLSCWSAQGSIYTTLMWLYVLESIAYTVQHVAYIGNEACAVYAWPICALSNTVESHIVVQLVTRAQCLVGVVYVSVHFNSADAQVKAEGVMD